MAGCHSPPTLEKRKISISQLELFALAMLVKLMATSMQHQRYRRFLIYSDNEGAVFAANSGRTSSAAMAKALEIFIQSCDAARIEVQVVHIPGDWNTISDALSRNELEKATSICNATFGKHEMLNAPVDAHKLEEELAEAAIQSRSALERGEANSQ